MKKMSKVRTNIYISEAARAKVREYKVNLSAFVEEQIFNNFGYSASLAELESEIEETKQRLQILNTKLQDFSDNKERLREYCVLIADRTRQTGKSVDWVMTALAIHRRDKPMCDMSTAQLKAKIEEYL